MHWRSLLVSVLAAASLTSGGAAADIVELLPAIKPSVVGVGSIHPLRIPRQRLAGTGFVVADGRHVITNAHVAPQLMEVEKGETLAILIRTGNGIQVRRAEKVADAPDQDLLLLRVEGDPLPALKIGDSDQAREGQTYYFTGFPIGAAIGLYPATHRAGLAAIAPIYQPPATVKGLTPQLIRRAADPYLMFQLDGTAYPGNSGSPLYDGSTGEVMAVINAVFVKGAKENAIKDPSGITYAIPSRYVRALLERAGLKP
ncbi:MAG: trypsin-like peptidase domain-containing protein [Betaproteobacteria bacterium]|nr:trypsin-like peptidase domain-containing protein [Betaproteobacteria bacterium]